MKSAIRPTAPATNSPLTSKVGRRSLVVGAGVAGAAALAAHAVRTHQAEPVVAAAPRGAAGSGEGYRLTDHVRRYYETTKA